MVNFKNTIIIMTSNMGSQIIQENFESVNEQNVEAVTEKTKVEVMNILKQNIRPEFLNRIDEIIMFKPLMKNEIRGIIQIQLNGLCELLKSQGVQLEFSPFALDYLSEQGYDPQYGARPLKRVIQKEIVNLLSKKIIAGEIDKEKKVVMDVFDGVVVLRNE
jgi:ATP-dependent Clp protease ATP-binding subunit ClpB